MTKKRRLPMEYEKFDTLIAQFSDQHKREVDAVEAILAEYSISHRMLQKLAREWLVEAIDQHRHPEAYEEIE